MLNNGDTAKAVGKFEKAIAARQETEAANYGLGICYIGKDNGKAWRYLKNVEQRLRRPQKNLAESLLKNYNITSDLVKEKIDMTAASELQRIINEDFTEHAFDVFLRNFNGCGVWIADSAAACKETIAYNNVLKEKTAAVANDYLTRFPKSKHYAEVNALFQEYELMEARNRVVKHSESAVNAYITKYNTNKERYMGGLVKTTYRLKYYQSAILALFDRNYDGIISKHEFNFVTESQYYYYTLQVGDFLSKADYYSETWGDIPYYQDLEELLEDEIISTEELVYFDANHSHSLQKKLEKNVSNLPEFKHLKDIYMMNYDELTAELKKYGASNHDIDSLKQLGNDVYVNYKMRLILDHIRERITLYDQNSDTIDFHIGTFIQGHNGLCSFLASIETYSDERLRSLYSVKTDEIGEKYYEIMFPIDSADHKTIIITDSELNSGEVIYDYDANGSPKIMSELPRGDKDVTLLSMAFLKRFGNQVYLHGEYMHITQNMLKYNSEPEYEDFDKLQPEDFAKIKPNSIIAVANLREKGYALGKYYQLCDGKIIGVSMLSIGIKGCCYISRAHAHSVRGYDKKTDELIICPIHNTSIEVRIPSSIADFIEVARYKQ